MYGLANQELCYIQMLLNIEKSGEKDKERLQECLVNTGPNLSSYRFDVTSGLCRSDCRQILDSSKLKEFPDDDFIFDENGRVLLKRIENAVGKKEKLLVTSIFSFTTVFSKDVYCRHVKNKGLFGKGLR